MFTKNGIIREYFRLCAQVNEAEEVASYKWEDESGEEMVAAFSLLDADQAQRMREEYHERAEAVLAQIRKEANLGATLTRL